MENECSTIAKIAQTQGINRPGVPLGLMNAKTKVPTAKPNAICAIAPLISHQTKKWMGISPKFTSARMRPTRMPENPPSLVLN